MEMRGLTIPDRFKIFARTFTVEEVPEITYEGVKRLGECNFDDQVIKLRSDLGKDQKEHVFLHELTHAILSAMDSELYDNEPFVEVFSGLLHQALTTSEKDVRRTRYVDPQPNGTVTTTL